MKRIEFCTAMLALSVLFCITGCEPVENGFTSEEVGLIKGGAGDVMRVLKSDEPEDLAVLRLTAKPLTDRMMETEAFGRLCERMLATVQAPENDGVGIAAPQVGISRRLVAVQRFDKEGEPFEFFVNPEIVRYGAEITPGGEGCLSVPEFRGTVNRSQEIDLRYRTGNGTDTLETVKGFTAVIFQHELDHLDGVLYTDRALKAGNDHMETRTLDDGSRITWIQDNAEPRYMPLSLFPDADKVNTDDFKNGVPSSVSVFLLEKDGVRILFDAGNGTPDSRLPVAFKSLGLTYEDIDYVFITHLHGDHIGGMLLDSKAVFPRAEVYVSKEEHDGWMSMPEDKNGAQRQMMAAYEGRIRLFSAGDRLPCGVEAIAAHGHTPGHTVFRSGNMLIVGDILHGMALQVQDPEICATFDMDKKKAVESRRMVLGYASDNSLTMCGMHFPGPAFSSEN